MAPGTQALVTEAEFLDLPETMDRIELLDGEVIMPPAPSSEHQGLVIEVAGPLWTWARSHPPAAVRVAPLDVRFGPERILQPDLMVFLGGLPVGAPTPLASVPDLCVEVLSSRRSYDRITKRQVYADAGVREYWVVDPVRRLIEVYQGLVLKSEENVGLTSDLLPDFALDVRALWPR
jgi:Uma2 family endonuclease